MLHEVGDLKGKSPGQALYPVIDGRIRDTRENKMCAYIVNIH